MQKLPMGTNSSCTRGDSTHATLGEISRAVSIRTLSDSDVNRGPWHTGYVNSTSQSWIYSTQKAWKCSVLTKTLPRVLQIHKGKTPSGENTGQGLSPTSNSSLEASRIPVKMKAEVGTRAQSPGGTASSPGPSPLAKGMAANPFPTLCSARRLAEKSYPEDPLQTGQSSVNTSSQRSCQQRHPQGGTGGHCG